MFQCRCRGSKTPAISGTCGRRRLIGWVSGLLTGGLKVYLKFTNRGGKEMGEYYNRKVAEGKNKMLVMNALRCKVIQSGVRCC